MIERGHSWAPWFRRRVQEKRDLALTREFEELFEGIRKRQQAAVTHFLSPSADPYVGHEQWPVRS